MTESNIIAVWMQQIRAPFLILAIVLVLIGVAAANWYGFQNWPASILLLVGVILTHVSVNLFNELSDYETGIDARTTRTPFSGGSGMLQHGDTTPRAVRTVAYTTLFIAGLIGLYFCLVTSWLILAFMVVGAVAIRFYTSHMARWMVGEIISGITLGSMVVLGVFLALTGSLTLSVVMISIPPGILTALLLFLNQFPDMEADRDGGRRHLVILLGRSRSRYVYLAGLFLVYAVIAISPLLFNVPYGVLISLITLPLAIRGLVIVFKNYDTIPGLIPALAMNVGVVLLTDLLIAVGYFLG